MVEYNFQRAKSATSLTTKVTWSHREMTKRLRLGRKAASRVNYSMTYSVIINRGKIWLSACVDVHTHRGIRQPRNICLHDKPCWVHVNLPHETNSAVLPNAFGFGFEYNCAVLTLRLLGHVIRLDGRYLDAPGGSDVDHEGRHHAVVMVVRRQGCGGAGTAGQATTTAAPASTPARLRPSPTPAAPRSLHHGDGRRQLLPPGSQTERTPRALVQPRATTAPSQHSHPKVRFPATSQQHTDRITTAPLYFADNWTFRDPVRMRTGTAPVRRAPPISYRHWLHTDPSLAVINASDYQQLEMKRKWLLCRCHYHRSEFFLLCNASTAQYHAQQPSNQSVVRCDCS